MVETTQGNGAEPRRPKKVQRKGPAKTGKVAAIAQLVERPELIGNVSAAARLWGVSRSTAREWMRAAAAMVVPPEPPLAEPAAMATSSPDPATAMAEPAPPAPVAGAMVNPSHDEPFQAEPPLCDEQLAKARSADGGHHGSGRRGVMVLRAPWRR